jgi:hypothetical protein
MPRSLVVAPYSILRYLVKTCRVSSFIHIILPRQDISKTYVSAGTTAIETVVKKTTGNGNYQFGVSFLVL